MGCFVAKPAQKEVHLDSSFAYSVNFGDGQQQPVAACEHHGNTTDALHETSAFEEPLEPAPSRIVPAAASHNGTTPRFTLESLPPPAFESCSSILPTGSREESGTHVHKIALFPPLNIEKQAPLERVPAEPQGAPADTEIDGNEFRRSGFFSGTSLMPSVQSSEADRARPASWSVPSGPSREPSIPSRFMTLVEGEGPTSREMWAQLGSDVMMEHARRMQMQLEASTLSEI